MHHPVIIGVVGGIGSGKSAVCRWVREHDPSIRVIDADADGHRALALPAVKDQLRDIFGDGIFDSAGQVDRSAVAARVFGESEEKRTARGRLESIVHPAIRQLRDQQLTAFAAEGKVDAVLIDAAILLEAGWKERCDKVVFVDVPKELRVERVRPRGWSEAELVRREASQWPLERKKEAADFVVDNSQSLDNAGRQMYEYIRRTVASAGK